MIIDLLLAGIAGIGTHSFGVFLIVIVFAALFWSRHRPHRSGLVRFALFAFGISMLVSLFGNSDCEDWDAM